jgi:Ni,Fe-hydrogenase III small subunit
MMLGHVFAHSIHVRVLDAGACRACLSEIEQLGKPYYNVHRLGFFITPTPRQADVLLVAGPVTDNMRLPLQKTYDAMPTPKKVIAAGTCALSGGVFGPSFTCEAGVSKVIPVDVEITGCPPPPLALIHGLLVVAGRQSGKLPVPARELKGGQRDD